MNDHKTKRRITIAKVVLLVVVGLLIAVANQNLRSEHNSCDPRTVAEQILTTERPQMGPIERKMWLDVLAKHYEARGLSSALGASLLAQENQFKTYRVSSTGAQGAFQIMPGIWKGTKECPKNTDLFEVEPAADCSGRILRKYIDEGGSVEAGLRRYVAGPHGQARAQWYADQIITRLARATAQCPAFQALLVVKK